MGPRRQRPNHDIASQSRRGGGLKPAKDSSPNRSKQRRRLIFESLAQRRVLAVITGTIYHDEDGSLRQEPAEVRLDSRLAYIDQDDSGTFDAGERFAVADELGKFRFEDVPEGIHSVRLFDGDSGQRQTFPAAPSERGLPAGTSQPAASQRVGESLHLLSGNSLIQLDVSGTRASVIDLEFEADALVTSVVSANSDYSAAIVSGADEGDATSGNGLWMVPLNGSEQQLLYENSEVLDSSIGPDGAGVILTGDATSSIYAVLSIELQSVSASDSSPGFVTADVSPTPASVPSNAQIISSTDPADLDGSEMGSRTIFAWPADTDEIQDDSSRPALVTSVWSNTAASWVSGSRTVIDGAVELVSFDDQAGLLAVRDDSGQIEIYDVDSNFAPLATLDDANGMFALVPGQDAILNVTAEHSGSRWSLTDLRSGQVIADHLINDSGLGQPVSIVPGKSLDEFFVVGTTGSTRIRLDQPAAHRIAVDGALQEFDVDFGVRVNRDNRPPSATGEIDFVGVEDQPLEIPASETASFVSDPDGDPLVSLLIESPANGQVEFSPGGGFAYIPDQDFFGSDSFAIAYHDGQGLSSPIYFNVDLAGSADIPSGIVFVGDAVPENAESGYEIGSIEVVDPDFDNDHPITVYDSRFRVVDGMLVLVYEGLDYETEEVIPVTIAGYDREAGQFFDHTITVHVQDANDPVHSIYPRSAGLTENETGVLVTTLEASDEDVDQTIAFSVDDDRFEVIGQQLWLKDGQSIDYEAEPVVVLVVTADDQAGSTASTELSVSVGNVAEAITSLELSNQSVLEMTPGAVVGDVMINGVSLADSYNATVDDPRFEINGSVLKLADSESVLRSDAEEIQLTITARDVDGAFDAASRVFIIEVLENSTPFHNDDSPHDVDGNGVVTPVDALTIINYLNLYGPGPVGPGDTDYGYDVNGDGQVSAIDALLIINFINRLGMGGNVNDQNGSGENTDGAADGIGSGNSGGANGGEGESVSDGLLGDGGSENGGGSDDDGSDNSGNSSGSSGDGDDTGLINDGNSSGGSNSGRGSGGSSNASHTAGDGGDGTLFGAGGSLSDGLLSSSDGEL